MPGAEKWNTEAVSKIGCAPDDLHQPREPEVTFREKKEDSHEEPQRKVVMAQQVCIKLADIERYGLTTGCKTCDHERNYGPGRASAGHSKLCRDRIMNEIARLQKDLSGLQWRQNDWTSPALNWGSNTGLMCPRGR